MLLFASELYCHAGLLDPCESLFIDKLRESGFESQHLFARTAQQELNRIQNVTLSRPIQTSDRIELWIKSRYNCSIHVSFESLQDYLFHVHP